MCDCDFDSPAVYAWAARKASKPHRCDECGRAIARGESYEEHSGLWDGRWATYRWCAHCSAAEKILASEIEDFCFCFTLLWEAVHDMKGYRQPYPGEHTRRLVAGARRKWTYRRGPKAGQLMPVPAVAPMPAKVAS